MFTPAANRVLVQAEQEARNLGHNYLGATHLVLALAEKGHLKGHAEYSRLRSAVTRLTPPGYGSGSTIAYTPRFRKITELAAQEAGGSDVKPEHLVLGLVNHGTSVGAQALRETASLTAVKDSALQATGRAPLALDPQARIESKIDRILGHLGIR